MKPLLISFTGVDGSGKSTLTRALVERLKRENQKTDYLWWFAAESSWLRRAVRFFATAKSQTGSSKNSGRHELGHLKTAYQYLVLIDYERQVLLHVTLPLALGRNVVCDRYVNDVAISFAAEFGYSEARARRLIRALRILAPRPDITFLVDVPSEIAVQRKHDIPSVQQQEDLRALYLRLVNDEDVVLLDGARPLEELNNRIWARVSDRLRATRGVAVG